MTSHNRRVLTAHRGRNNVMIADAARLYIPAGATVLDCTWGRGNFWTRTDTSSFRLIGLDLVRPRSARADFRSLPLRDASVDVAVLDPPYMHAPGQRYSEVRYLNRETTPSMTWEQIMDLYRQGIEEAIRVVRPGGTIWVKCQDTVESHVQRWSMVTVHLAALALGLTARDLFVVMTDTPPGGTGYVVGQRHARKNHSYLWIFGRDLWQRVT